MKSLTDEAIDKRDYRDCLEIHIDGKKTLSFYEGEPEDASMGRDYNDVWSIPDVMKAAHEAGKKGEELEIEHKLVDIDDMF